MVVEAVVPTACDIWAIYEIGPALKDPRQQWCLGRESVANFPRVYS